MQRFLLVLTARWQAGKQGGPVGVRAGLLFQAAGLAAQKRLQRVTMAVQGIPPVQVVAAVFEDLDSQAVRGSFNLLPHTGEILLRK